LPLPELKKVLDDIAPSIRTLYLGANASLQTEQGMHLLGSWIPTAHKLLKLDLRYNDIGPAGIAAFLSPLAEEAATPTTLEILHLEGNCLGDVGVAHLATSLLSQIKLRELYLGANSIGPDGATALAEAAVRSSLTKLYLEGNHIGPDGAAAFTRALLEQSSSVVLKHLFVDNNDIGKEVSQALARALNGDSMVEDIVTHYNAALNDNTSNEEEKKE
jgi:Ran GTPase-activating protein (RanGAP) involved in mRNA processing and transport